MVSSNVDAVYDGPVGNHARCVSHDVVDFIFSVSIRASACPSPPCFLLKLCVHDKIKIKTVYCHVASTWILKLFDVAHSTSVSSFISLAQAEASCRLC